MSVPAIVVVGLLAVMAAASVVAFVLFGLDKRAARRGERRRPERVLVWWSLAGGWLGAFAAMSLFRHKTCSPGFRRRIWGAAVVHAVLVGAALVWWVRSR